MRYLATTLLATILFASPLIAQEKPVSTQPSEPRAKPEATLKATVPMVAIMENKRLSGPTKMRCILRQLDLDREQRDYARDLIDTIFENGEGPQLSLPEIHSIVAEIQQAKEDGDEKRAAELGQQLRNMARGSDHDDEFMLNMETVLTDKQKVAMHEAYERLERNPSGALRPIDLVRLAYELGLSSEQRAKVEKLRKILRDDLRRVGRRKLDDQWRFQTINKFVDSINHILTDEQRQVFSTNIRKIRPDLAMRLAVQPASVSKKDGD